MHLAAAALRSGMAVPRCVECAAGSSRYRPGGLFVRPRVLSRCSDFTFTSIGPSLPTAVLRVKQSLSLSLSSLLPRPFAVLVCSIVARLCAYLAVDVDAIIPACPGLGLDANRCYRQYLYCHLSRDHGPHPTYTTPREPPTATRGLLILLEPSGLRNSTSQLCDAADRTPVPNCCEQYTTPT